MPYAPDDVKNNSYALDDYLYSLDRAKIDPSTIDTVVAAWGWLNYPGGYSDWSGGFLLYMKDGSYVYIAGWCDTTGWGCQDGAEMTKFTDSKPDLSELKQDAYLKEGEKIEWDLEPIDLNKWHRDGCPNWPV